MHPNLQSIGIHDVESIERYSLRQEGQRDILKIYFRKSKRDFLARSSKFKFQRQEKRVSGGYVGQHFTKLSEINPTLRKIISELDKLALHHNSEKQIKEQILDDLKHLEGVVANKIKEIEAKLALL